VKKNTKRTYDSSGRQRQAAETRQRIIVAAQKLLKTKGYEATTIDAIAQRAEVSAQSVYAIFKSKLGILRELLDRSTFGPEYERLVSQAWKTKDPESRLRLAARIARQIHDNLSATFDLLRGAGMLAPQLASLERNRESMRYQRQETMIASLRDVRKLRPNLGYHAARDVFWMLTGQDVYRLLVRERGWSSDRYQRWLADTLVSALMRTR
jgi:AcrR family transcriptional regulator